MAIFGYTKDTKTKHYKHMRGISQFLYMTFLDEVYGKVDFDKMAISDVKKDILHHASGHTK